MKTCEEPGCEATKLVARGLCTTHYHRARRAGQLPKRTTRELFFAKLQPDAQCLVWQGSINSTGYGTFNAGGKTVLAHRYAWELENGPIPAGAEIDHTCHTTACCLPAHLRLADRKQNMEHQKGAHKGSTSGIRGVYWNKDRQRWQVQVRHNKVPHYGGLFEDIKDAEAAAMRIRRELFTRNDGDRTPARS